MATKLTTYDCTAAEVIPLTLTVLEAGDVPYILGPPGLGKSTMMNFICEMVKRKMNDMRLAYYMPTDLSGMPHLNPDSRKMEFAEMGLLPDGPGQMLFLDEFPLAPRATQNAALQLVLDGRVGSYTLPDDTWVVMAGNRLEDRCFGDRASSAMVNRVVVLRVKPDLDSWIEWAFNAGIDPTVVAYVQFNPNSLLDFNPTTWDGESNFASPRSWEALDRILKTPRFKTLSRDAQRKLIVGRVGPAVGSEFAGYLEVHSSLPNIAEILLDPRKATLPTEASARIGAVAMCANHTDRKTLGTLLEYVGRFEKRFEVFYVKAITGRDKSLLTSKELITWVIDNKDVFQSA